jgi:hypothetical protein
METGGGKQETGNRRRETGDGRREAGSWERNFELNSELSGATRAAIIDKAKNKFRLI